MSAMRATTSSRRQPKQRRSRQTVDAVLDAVLRILKREGLEAVTTNRIAEIAGVSIGTLYQYFQDKQAIFVALHDRHVSEVDRIITAKIIENAGASLEGFIRDMLDTMIEIHKTDPKLHELLAAMVPPRPGGKEEFAARFQGAFRLMISSKATELARERDLDAVAFVAANMVEVLSHSTAIQRPAQISLARAKEEAIRAILSYLRS